MLEIKNLHARIAEDGTEIIRGLNLTVNAGEVAAIMGPNGSGKSTLSYILAGREDYEVTEGDILFNGESILEMDPAQRVQFQRLNFMDTDFGLRDTFDVIFFRNVMIYFDKPTQAAVVRRMCRNLRGGGFLYTSHSESLMGLDVPLRMVAPAVYLR